MQPLTKVLERTEATAIQIKLESAGIPVYIGGDSAGPGFGAVYGSGGYTVWVEIDDQLSCAARMLEDEDYQPVKPINIEEYRATQQVQLEAARDEMSKFGEYILNLVAVIAIGAAGFYLYAKVFM